MVETLQFIFSSWTNFFSTLLLIAAIVVPLSNIGRTTINIHINGKKVHSSEEEENDDGA